MGLKETFGISREYLRDAASRSHTVEVSSAEAEVVNRWSSLDVCLDMLMHPGMGSYSQRLERMTRGKVDDYRLFVVLYEDKNSAVMSNLERCLKYSPCGRAKLDALRLRSPRGSLSLA
jgi:hypothetical protein